MDSLGMQLLDTIASAGKDALSMSSTRLRQRDMEFLVSAPTVTYCVQLSPRGFHIALSYQTES